MSIITLLVKVLSDLLQVPKLKNSLNDTYILQIKTYLDFSSVDSKIGIGHRDFLQSSYNALRGPPFFILTDKFTAKQ